MANWPFVKLKQGLHVGVGIARQRSAALIIRHEIAGRDDRHVVVIDDLVERVGDRGDLRSTGRPGNRGRSARCIARAWRDIGERAGLRSGCRRRRRRPPPDAARPGTNRNRPSQPAGRQAEIKRRGGRGINNRDLLDGMVHRHERRGVDDVILPDCWPDRSAEPSALLIRALKSIEVGAVPPDGVSSDCGIA